MSRGTSSTSAVPSWCSGSTRTASDLLAWPSATKATARRPDLSCRGPGIEGVEDFLRGRSLTRAGIRCEHLHLTVGSNYRSERIRLAMLRRHLLRERKHPLKQVVQVILRLGDVESR